MRTASLFEADRLTLDDAIAMSLDSLAAYGERYRHWAVAYSGGKDSTGLVAFVLWALAEGKVKPPESLTVLYADTRQELPPLQAAALRILDIQRRARVDLVNADEEQRIRELWAANTWPNKWTGDEVTGDVALDAYTVTALGDIVTQPLLVQ